MKIKSLVCISIALIVSCSAMAGFSTATGYNSSVVYTASGTAQPIINGMDIDGGNLYAAQGTDMVTIDTTDNSSAVTGNMPSAAFNSLVVRYNGTTYTSYATLADSANYTIGYIDGNGDYQAQTTVAGIYDMAVNSAGDAYIVAGGDILKYDLVNGTTSLAASVGGYSGGIAFDSAGNLYYADQGVFGVRDASLIKYSVDAAGVLDMSSSTSVASIAAGYIGFDENDNFYATTGWGAAFSQYDLTDGSLVQDIAYGGIGQFTFDGDSIYLLDTDWSAYASTIYEVTAVPEPATLMLLGLGAVGLFRRSRS